ncbi:MAG: XRE family transcriptional regulator, partial [Alphaproteobacteria bacterium]
MMKKKIPEDKLYLWSLDVQDKLYDELRKAYDASGLSQDEVALRLGKDKAQISRWLNGTTNMHLRSYSDLARALDCRLNIIVESLSSIPRPNSGVDPFIGHLNSVTAVGSGHGGPEFTTDGKSST